MDRIIEPLSAMGADITASDADGHPPLQVKGGKLKGIEYRSPVPSAQVKSAILLAGLGASGTTTVVEPVPTRDHTERMLGRASIKIKREGASVTVQPGVPEAQDLDIPGDISSAAFLIAAALLCPDSDITVASVGLNPTRTAFLELLRKMGAVIDTTLDDTDDWEPSGSIRVRHGQLSAIELGPQEVAGCIDEVTLVALLATQAEGETRIRGAGELRHKESDRIRSTVDALGALGAKIEETGDGMVIRGPTSLDGTGVSAGGDHRIAMMLALGGLVADGRTVVSGWEWSEISFPGFVQVLIELGAEVE
jgi:3-phosphoshikimate 1-carboxyvinyltransferase